MRKSIIATSYKNWPAKIGKDLTKSMLRSRAEEVVMGVADGKKFTLYKDEVEAVLNLRLFE